MNLDLNDRVLLRGWMQGIPWLTLAELYQPEALPSDTKRYVETLLADLVVRAQRLDRRDLAAALMAGGSRAETALDELLALPEPRPSLHDPVSRWLTGRVAKPLEKAGFPTLAHVLDAGALAEWWRDIPRLGTQGVEAVRALFALYPELGVLRETVVLGSEPTVPVRLPSQNLAPLECFLPFPPLDGGERQNRAPVERLRIAALNDREAVLAWLAQWPEDSATYRAYRKEAERCLLWSVLERHKPFSAMTVDDAVAYRGFLADPQPRERWVGPLAPRQLPRWKPFQDRLSPRSAQYAETVLRSLCQWLVDVGYLGWNPFAGLRRARHSEEGMAVGRALSEPEWRWVMDFCERGLDDPAGDPLFFRHARFALRLGYYTGLRISNLAAATVGDLERRTISGNEGPQWWLHSRVKGDKPHRVPVTGLMAELRDYLRFRGYPAPLETLDPEIPLIGKRRLTRTERGYREVPYTPSGLHDLICSLFELAGDALAATDPLSAERIRSATTHVLRHTHATHALGRGVPVTVAQRNLGHSSLAITSRYITVEDDQRHAEIAKLLTPNGS